MAVVLAAASGNTEHVNPSGGNIVLADPATEAGNTRIHYLWQVGGPDQIPDTGTGFTSIGTGLTTVGSGVGFRAAYKIASGSEGNVTHTTPGTDVVSTGYAMRVTGAHATAPINASAVGLVEEGASPVVLPTVITDVPNCLIVYYFIHSTGTLTPTMAGVGAAFDTHINNGSLDIAAVYSELQVAAGESTPRTVSWASGVSALPFAVIAIAPAAAPQSFNVPTASLVLSGVPVTVETGTDPQSFDIPTATLTLSAIPPDVFTAPDPVDDLTGTPGNESVDLTWSAPGTGGSPITDYIVQFKEAAP